MSEEEEQFTSGEDYQTKLISFMLSNPEFRDIAHVALKDEDFANTQLQWYFDSIGSAPIPLTPVTLQEELLRAVKSKQIKDIEIEKFVHVFGLVTQPPMITEEEYIKKDLSRFMKTQAMKRVILDSFELIDKGHWDAILDKVTEATQVGMDITNKGQDYFGDFEDRLHRRNTEVSSKKLSTGIPELDEMMYGGLKQKQVGLVAGGTGRGKSIFLEWLGRTALLLGETVFYYTLELPEDEIGARYDSLFSRVKMGELKDYHTDVYRALEDMSTTIKGKLIIKEYPADGATIGTIKQHIRQMASLGIRPGLVIIDYLDLLKPHREYKSTHEELDAITKAMHGMSKELDLRIWTATQLNRSGITAETPDETSVSGALAKLFTVDVALFLAQTNEEREDEMMRIIIAKNRNGKTGRVIKIDTDYAYMTFYRSSVAAIP